MDPEGWQELPLLMPKHMIQARQIRHTFTGDLESSIHTSPVFEGREKHYVEKWLMSAEGSAGANRSFD